MQERLKVACPVCKGEKHLHCDLCRGDGYYKIDKSLEGLPTLDIPQIVAEARQTEFVFREDMMRGHHQYA